VRSDRAGDVARREVGIVFFGHLGVRVAKMFCASGSAQHNDPILCVVGR
jgi:hypothetical protein